MKSKDLIESQEDRTGHGLLGELLHGLAEPLVDTLDDAIEPLLRLGITDGRQDKRAAIGDELERRVRSCLQQFKYGLVDDDRVAVAVLDEVFDHGGLRLPEYCRIYGMYPTQYSQTEQIRRCPGSITALQDPEEAAVRWFSPRYKKPRPVQSD